MRKWWLVAVHTMEELKLTGNHLKGARAILSFSGEFDQHPHLQLLKELLTQVTGLGNHLIYTSCKSVTVILKLSVLWWFWFRKLLSPNFFSCRFSAHQRTTESQNHSLIISLHFQSWTTTFGSATTRYPFQLVCCSGWEYCAILHMSCASMCTS